MEKQYATHYLPERYKQHQFIDIYNFEITILERQSTAQRQKLQGNRDVRFFSSRAHGSGHRVCLAKRPRPSLQGTIMEKLSGGIRVRIPQELDVVAFWSWNLDVVVFQSWNLDVVAFCPLKKCLGITMSWLICLRFSISWFFGLGISMSWFFGLGIQNKEQNSIKSKYICIVNDYM